MARPVTWPPIIRVRHGRAVIRVRGKDYTLGAPGSPEAAREYARLLVVLAEGGPTGGATPPDPGSATIDDVIARWWAHAEQTYSARGRELSQYRHTLRPLRRLFGPSTASAFKVAQLEQLQTAMATGSWMTPQEKAEAMAKGLTVGWCRNVCHRRVTRILTMAKWAERQGLIPEGRHAHLLTRAPLPRGGKVARDTAPREPCSLEDVRAAAAKAPPPVAAMLLLQWLTGMRPGEVRILRPCDVDRSGDVWFYRPSIWKTEHLGHPRVVPLGPEAQAVLLPWLDAAPTPDSWCFRPLKARRGNATPTYRAGCYSTFSYCQAVRRACEAAGVKLIPYQNRHAAKRRLADELGDSAARAVLGQVSMESTAFYARQIDLKAATDAARKLG